MKWKTIGLIPAVCLVLLSVSIASAGTLTTETVDSLTAAPPPVIPGLTIDQQQSTDSGATYMAVCSGHPWQTFVPSKEVLSAGAIHIGFDNPIYTENLTMHIRTAPDGPDLTSVTVPESRIIIGDWVTFDFPDIKVVPGNTYYLVMDDEGTLSYYGWSVQRDYDSYPPGKSCSGGVEDWTFATYFPGANPTVFISTDKITYRPGETVQLKVNISNPTGYTYSSNIALNITWPSGNGMNFYTKSFTMTPGFEVAKVSPMPIPDSIFVADGEYRFTATLTYDGSSTSSTSLFTIRRI